MVKRFLVLQAFFVGKGEDRQDLKEPVIDFHTKSEADDWVNNQPDPTLFEIEDQFPEDDEPNVNPFDAHDFDAYNSVSPAYGWDDDDFDDDLIDDSMDEDFEDEEEDDYPDFDGDGDAD